MTRTPHSSFRWFLGGAVAALALSRAPAPLRAQAGTEVLADIDLSTPFRTRSSWRFTAIQEKLPTDPKLAFDYSSSTLQ
ncbi:MAG TPA: hypothetical protein VHX64_10640, partial [Caulobacteraceae bacterium]|nr:hypothetical protein [Caulobacteraceae bacterium]